jgi:ribosome-associated toxin RatA of RatAB toxin-antitoxin module
MAEIQKTALVEFSADQMFKVVDGVVDYPEFLPWCGGTSVEPQDDKVTHATIKINYHHVKHSFTTENTRQPPHLIEMTLLDGPFEHLDGHWKFIPLSDKACKVEFRLHYAFSHKLLEKLVGPVFYVIANSFVESFIKRAEDIYESDD